MVGSSGSIAALLQTHAAQVLHRRPLEAGQEVCMLQFAGAAPTQSAQLSLEAVNLEDLFLELA